MDPHNQGLFDATNIDKDELLKKIPSFAINGTSSKMQKMFFSIGQSSPGQPGLSAGAGIISGINSEEPEAPIINEKLEPLIAK